MRKLDLTVSRPPFKVRYESQVHLFRIPVVPVLTFEKGKSHSFLEITKKNLSPRVYWFARRGKQPTPGKILAKAILVSGDTGYDYVRPMQAGLRKLVFGSKTYKVVVGVCVHTMGCIEERNGSRYAMDGSGQSLCGPCLRRVPGEVPQTAAPSCLLTS